MKALLHRKYLPFLTTPSDRIFRGFFYQFHHPTLYARMVSLSLSSAIAFFISLYLTFCQSLSGFAPIFPDTCYHLTHYWPAAADIPVASDNPVH
ncbi:hypothetical protein ACRWUP_25675, partial [Escherichia coli]|uniref:hypothetical protein n=1 Tax=Escherichia coli TaxID=562 RepID=UPI003F67DADE